MVRSGTVGVGALIVKHAAVLICNVSEACVCLWKDAGESIDPDRLAPAILSYHGEWKKRADARQMSVSDASRW